jgi:anaphase-promoting complex subunit 3
VPGGAAGHYLLGLICRKTNRSAPAISHFRNALTADPFCWSAYEELCALGDEHQAAALLDNAKCGDSWHTPVRPAAPPTLHVRR